jgi:hypothetical protein
MMFGFADVPTPYQYTFIATCIVRGEFACDVTFPNVPVLTVVLGPANCG